MKKRNCFRCGNPFLCERTKRFNCDDCNKKRKERGGTVNEVFFAKPNRPNDGTVPVATKDGIQRK